MRVSDSVSDAYLIIEKLSKNKQELSKFWHDP